MDLKAKMEVKYTGVNRPQLKGLRGVIERVSDFNNSSFVNFYNESDRLVTSVWVGAGGLEAYTSAGTIERLLQQEFDKVNEEFRIVEANYNALRVRRAQLTGALNSFKNTTFR